MHTVPQSTPEGKVCPACGQWKPFTEYYRKRQHEYQTRCKPCFLEANARNRKAQYEADPERFRAAARKYWREHRDECLAKDRAYREAHPDRRRETYRKSDAKRREQRVEYRKANAEHIKARNAEYRQRKKAEIDAYNAAYREAHKQELTERQRRWREAHPEEYLAIRRRWKQDHQEACLAMAHRRRRREDENGGSFTAEEWKAIKEAHNFRCLMCGRQEPEIKLTIDHIIPVADGGSNDAGNLQPLCRSCNSKKHCKVLDLRRASPP